MKKTTAHSIPATAAALIALFCAPAPAFSQDSDLGLPRIAVYVTGGDSVSAASKDALGAYMLDALVNSGRYRAIERSGAFLAEIDREHVKQRDGSVDDAQISEIGKQSGVRFVCVAGITPALGSYQVSARIIDVETADVSASGVFDGSLETLDDLKRAAAAVVYKMLGIRVKAERDFELVTEREQSVLERSIEQTVRQTMQTKPPKRGSFWAALSLDIAGAGALGYGVYEEISVSGLIARGDFSQAPKHEKVRNICYVTGAVLLLSGISIHIFF
jgi:hypothetical protein